MLATVRGPVRDLLTAERTALNLLGHLSGIATLTRRWVDAVDGTGARIRDTRKTTPGLRALEKYAVRCGGGVNHRMSLSDAALVKDNHVAAAGGVLAPSTRCARAIPACRTRGRGRHRRPGARGHRGRRRPRPARQHGPARHARGGRVRARPRQLEASGGLRLENAREVAETGVDYLAVGALTHSAPVLDIGLDICWRQGLTMLLAIDIGNTNTVLGVFDGEKLEKSWRIKTDARTTADELALTFRGLLTDHEITGTAACSTVPAALRELRVMLDEYYPNLPTVLVEPGIRTGVSLQYENPKEVGADRIVNTLAAHHLVGDRPGDRRRLRHDDELRRRQRAGRLPRRRAGAGHRDLARRARRARGAAAQGRAGRAARTDRQEHGRGAAVRHPLRLRRPGRRHGAPLVRGARARRSRGASR